MAKRTPYDYLPILPTLMAQCVIDRPYTGQDGGTHRVAEVEAKRKAMTPEAQAEFCTLADKWCRDAYGSKTPNWFHKVATGGNRGRDRLLFTFLPHWLSAYLLVPDAFRRNVGAPTPDLTAAVVLGV